jgi:hypothetical protein
MNKNNKKNSCCCFIDELKKSVINEQTDQLTNQYSY